MAGCIDAERATAAQLLTAWFAGEGARVPVPEQRAPEQGLEGRARVPSLGGIASVASPSAPDLAALKSLYEASCAPAVSVLAHLGQSVDGFIAGPDGVSRGLSSAENIVHLHRLRALFDAVVIGGQTATVDDPRLTTRLVSGPNPSRVIVDPSLRCSPGLRLFVDGAAPTIVVCAVDAPEARLPARVQVLRLEVPLAEFTMQGVIEGLARIGLQRLFVEGGGRLVSRCVAEGVLQRLHIAVAPILLGNGVRGVQLEAVRRFRDQCRPPCRRFTMGADVLFDFDLGPLHEALATEQEQQARQAAQQ